MLVHVGLHVLVVLLLPPLFLGIVNKTKAAFGGRQGPPLLQAYYDLKKLAGKGMVLSSATSAIFLAGPAIGLVTALFAALLVPLGHHGAPIAFAGDMVLFAYLLGLGRFFTACAALDTGSPFEGMGASRELSFAWLAEPALFLGFVALSRWSGSFSLSGMLGGGLAGSEGLALGALLLVAAAWFVVLLAENCRIPFDDPKTHLELTMIHEVMVLDHSGPALGAILYGSSVKLFAMGALVIGLVLPFSLGPWIDWPVFLAGMVLLAVLIGAVESTMARLRLLSVPNLLISASLMAAFAIVFLMQRG